MQAREKGIDLRRLIWLLYIETPLSVLFAKLSVLFLLNGTGCIELRFRKLHCYPTMSMLYRICKIRSFVFYRYAQRTIHRPSQWNVKVSKGSVRKTKINK